MGLHEVSHASRFNSGADLWIIPERKNSPTAGKIDWYLNFQISRSIRYEAKSLPIQVLEILDKSGLEALDWKEKNKSQSLLVLSANALPNRWVMVVLESHEFQKWIENIREYWLKLSSPSLRIFLPAGVSGAQFENAWRKTWNPTLEELHKIGFVLES